MEQQATSLIDVHTLLLAVGLAQGLVLGMSLVLHGRKRNHAEIFLGLALVAFSLMLVDDVLFETRLLLRFPQMADIFSLFIFLPAPLFYLYVRTMTKPERPVRRGDLVHALPFLALAVITIPSHLEPAQAKLVRIQEMYQADRFFFNLAVLLPLAQLFAYFGAIAWLLVQHVRRVRREFSSLASVSLGWVRWLLGAYLAVAVTWLVSFWFRWSFGLQILDLVFVVAVYAFGYLGWRQPLIPTALSDGPQGRVGRSESESKPKYAKSALTPEQRLDLRNQLLAHMNRERPFLDPDLSLVALAGQLDVLPHNLSRVINESLNTTFFDLINSFRVKEAQRLLSNPSKREMKVLAVAFEAGFNSKSAFNAAFRHHTGRTPSSYRDQILSGGSGDRVDNSAA